MARKNQSISVRDEALQEMAPGPRWMKVEPLDGKPDFYLDVLDPTDPAAFETHPNLMVVVQPDDSVLYRAVCGVRTAYFSDWRDAEAQVIAWMSPETPRDRRGPIDSREADIGQDRPRNMRSDGPAEQSLDKPDIEVVDRPVNKAKLAQMSFNEEILEVVVHDTDDKTAEPYPLVINGGARQYFVRGTTQRVKRKFIEVLARAKKTTYTQRKIRDSEGNEMYQQIPHTTLLYPFSVISDPNPSGRVWLESILREA
jgi:hypothetical protein